MTNESLQEQIDQWRKDYASLSEECQYAKDAVRDLTIQLAAKMTFNNPNNWPLIPVNPECIPKGYRVVKCDTPKSTDVVVSSSCIPRLFGSIDYPRLIVERDVILKPTPPAWLNPEWWFAMDDDGQWFAYPEKPEQTEDNDWWANDSILLRDMPDLNHSRWTECCWKVGEP
jgi:hypothetical protein